MDLRSADERSPMCLRAVRHDRVRQADVQSLLGHAVVLGKLAYNRLGRQVSDPGTQPLVSFVDERRPTP
ncbi:hypothetical protein [Kibdelosporangium phytohabitans]|uniref:hypothetical protein n=1 Tax=Kibdelosporangium phytohabitans TaxID=860235 RepID=UPI0012F8DE1E|nr:hypothetical protein [Kibdelosporangium phytohabitans]MBE1461444.1 hypothetical protein [Kibdelosporangium phytohabitans]